MMVQPLNPYSAASKTEEILSRYRPIAPKPEIPAVDNSSSNSSCSSSSSHRIRHSPYLRNIWANLQARPTRTRKRGRSGISSPATLKRQTQLYQQHQFHHHRQSIPTATQMAPPPPPPPQFLGISCPSPLGSRHQTLPFQGFLSPAPPPHHHHVTCGGRSGGSVENQAPTSSIVTLPLLSCHSSSQTITHQQQQSPSPPQLSDPPCFLKRPDPIITEFDLNSSLPDTTIIDENDLQLQLKSPSTTLSATTTAVISPQPIRPIGSTITVCPTSPVSPNCWAHESAGLLKKPEQVEEEVEAEGLPIVISDSSHKVRMVNSAYKELVGQPECGWLDYVTGNNGKRISGEVVLQVSDEHQIMDKEFSNGGFSCWARIEWDDFHAKEKKKTSVSVYCDVSRLYCESRNYLFSWRFHTGEVVDTSRS